MPFLPDAVKFDMYHIVIKVADRFGCEKLSKKYGQKTIEITKIQIKKQIKKTTPR